MHKNTLKTLILVLATTLFVQKVHAADITVTCTPGSTDGTGDCVVSGDTAPTLFHESELSGYDLKPGDVVERTINVVNEGDETCYFYLLSAEQTNTPDPLNFPTKLWTVFKKDTTDIYGASSDGKPTSAATLQDIFDIQEPIPLIEASANETSYLDWLVYFDSTTGNDYQGSKTVFDFKMHFECGQEFAKEFTVAKTNFSWPTILTPGDTGTYQITVNSGSQPTLNARVTDLPPEGVTYIPGSWSASSDKRGNLKSAGITTEPTYASPGVWNLGNMEADETVTLTYIGEVNSDTTDGIYPDLALATGYTENEEFIFAQSTDSGFEIDGGIIDETAVGTQIRVKVEPESDEPEVEVEEEEVVQEQEVLGAAAQRLPATGANHFIIVLALILAFSGFITILINKKSLLKITTKLVIFSLAITLLAPKKALAAPDDLVFRISEPETPTNGEFQIDYVALETANREIKVECSIKKPGETTFSAFQTDNLSAGGDSGTCRVGETLLTKQGTHFLKVTASTTQETKEETTSVYLDLENPGKPQWIEKDKKSDCEYEVEFKTSKDGKTSYVEVYRSDDKKFTIAPSTKIRTIDIGPDETYEFTHKLYGSDCGNSYYAVRAFNEAGNFSNVRVEEIEDIIIKEITTETEEGEVEALIITTETGLVPEEGETPAEVELEEGEEAAPEEEGEEGEVEGEETEEEGISEEEGEVLGEQIRKFPWFLLLPAALIIGFIFLISKKRNNGFSS